MSISETIDFKATDKPKPHGLPRLFSSLVLVIGLAVFSSLATAISYYSYSFEEHKARLIAEKSTLLNLVSAFVSTYSGHRKSSQDSLLPVPATFRALALKSFNKKNTDGEKIGIEMVGVPGFAIKTEPSNKLVAAIVNSKSSRNDTNIQSELHGGFGQEVLRTIKPVVASKPSCVSCHNALQSKKKVWRLGDIMGAYVLEAPAREFFSHLRWETGVLSLAVFVFVLGSGAILTRHQNRIASARAEVQRENERGKMLAQARSQAEAEARVLSDQLRNANDKLEHSLAREKELSSRQRQFVSMASHEFRTPLAIIDSAAQRLKRRAETITPDDTVKRADKIRSAVKRMTRLMESTLSSARMEEGKIKIEIDGCDVAKVVREVCARQQDVANNHVINCNVADLPDIIQADTGALDQVLTNLLSNAVKYAPNAPDIDVTARREGHQVVMSVRDHGVGIDEDELGCVGERFFRARTSTGIAGTGIGLHLSKALVEMHGGSVNVDSKKGEGSTFTIRLPIAGPIQTESEKPCSVVA